MKKFILSLFVITLFFSCKPTAPIQVSQKQEVAVVIDLNNVKDDKVMVTISAPTITSDEIVYHLPKIIPGTYSEDDYGKFIDNLKAVDKEGKSVEVNKLDINSWTIKNAKNLSKITYWVNDTYDVEGNGGFGSGIFSPAGTNS